MESRFAHLRERDASVSMLRVKMSRRRSQSQKENRERTINTRRQLDMVQELDMYPLDATVSMANASAIQEKPPNGAKPAKLRAGEERLKQLQRWKERKAFEKEKEKREKERKGVFKTGLYHPKDAQNFNALPVFPAASTRAKEKKMTTDVLQSSRVTRSMKQQEVQLPVKMQITHTRAKKAPPAVERSTRTRVAPAATKTKVCAGAPAVPALSTRSTNRPPVPAAPPSKDKPKDKAADARTTRSKAVLKPLAPPADEEEKCDVSPTETVQPAVMMEQTEVQDEALCPLEPTSMPEEEEEDMVVDPPPVDPVGPAEPPSSQTSFAPTGFVFQAPAGLTNFKFEPLTSSSSINFPPRGDSPPESPHTAPPTEAPPAPGTPLESKHDVPYFRSQITNETERLTALSLQWESKVEDESIPEEMRDRIRTAVGQTRLLMKERFKQFGGLVDDCELGRGEKVTTCTDLQGFWDMVYYQVEDVNKKFEALKGAESRGWVEEHKPPPRQRKAAKKPSAAPVKPEGAKAAAAKSRLAAVKAAMKAKQQAAEKTTEDGAQTEDEPALNSGEPQAGAQTLDTVVFNGGFFQVESPAKPSGSVRRSSRLSAAVLPQPSPCSAYLSPRRSTRRSLALAQTPAQVQASPAQTAHTPAQFRLVLDKTPAPKPHGDAPRRSQRGREAVNVSLCFSPVKEELSDHASPQGSPAQQPGPISAEEDAASVPGPSADVFMLPTIAVVEEEEEELAQIANPDLRHVPRISISPSKTPAPLSEAAAPPSSSLSVTLSPCGAPIHPPAAQVISENQHSVCDSADASVVEEIPGLDFERYLQPCLTCTPSPRETVCVETPSPGAADVEMESPRGHHDDMPAQQEAELPEVSSALILQSPQVQTAESAMLLFTPDIMDRIRQSVCPSDLMVFTPPNA